MSLQGGVWNPIRLRSLARRGAALLLLSALGAVLPATGCLAWLNPARDRVAAGNKLFDQGKYDEAITKYGEALVDDPDSGLLNFNMGDANYKAGKYTEALASYSRVRGDDDPRRTARAAYNSGNAQYRLGAAAEAEKPQEALAAYAAALVAYRRALSADPTDQDTKFNYEFVSKKLDDLKKKLEEQKQQQDQQNQQADGNQGEPQPQPNEQKPQQGNPEQQSPPSPNQEAPEQQQRAAEDKSGQEKQPDQQQQPEQQAGAGQASRAEQSKDRMSPQEAAALIDTAKHDELQPDEFARQAQGGVIAEPAQDW